MKMGSSGWSFARCRDISALFADGCFGCHLVDIERSLRCDDERLKKIFRMTSWVGCYDVLYSSDNHSIWDVVSSSSWEGKALRGSGRQRSDCDYGRMVRKVSSKLMGLCWRLKKDKCMRIKIIVLMLLLLLFCWCYSWAKDARNVGKTGREEEKQTFFAIHHRQTQQTTTNDVDKGDDESQQIKDGKLRHWWSWSCWDVRSSMIDGYKEEGCGRRFMRIGRKGGDVVKMREKEEDEREREREKQDDWKRGFVCREGGDGCCYQSLTSASRARRVWARESEKKKWDTGDSLKNGQSTHHPAKRNVKGNRANPFLGSHKQH